MSRGPISREDLQQLVRYGFVSRSMPVDEAMAHGYFVLIAIQSHVPANRLGGKGPIWPYVAKLDAAELTALKEKVCGVVPFPKQAR